MRHDRRRERNIVVANERDQEVRRRDERLGGSYILLWQWHGHQVYTIKGKDILNFYGGFFLGPCIDDEVIDMQYRPLCSPKLKNSFLTRDHDKLTILASCLHLLSFLAPNPPKKWQVIYGWPCFEIIMACYSLLFPTIYLLLCRMHESR